MTESTYISLTTIPSRFSKIEKTLESLLTQTAEIKKIYLNIPQKYLRFPDWDGILPKVPKGITIRRIDKDLGPASKIIPTLKEIKDREAYILYCDDDWEYAPTWAQSFISHSQKKNSAIAASTFNVERLRKTNGIILQGFGGVLIQKNFFSTTDLIIPKPFTWVDDIWFSACLCKNKINIFQNKLAKSLYENNIDDKSALQNTLFSNMNRADLNKIASNYASKKFRIWE